MAVRPSDGRPERAALTSIYFLLVAGQFSRWHRVNSDEAWHFLEGDIVELRSADSDFADVTKVLLGPYGDWTKPLTVVPAGSWQTARCTANYALVACTVGPGFDFADFAMLRDHVQERGVLQSKYPELSEFI